MAVLSEQSQAPSFMDTVFEECMGEAPVPPAGQHVVTCVNVRDFIGVQRPAFEGGTETLDVTRLLFSYQDQAGVWYVQTKEMRIPKSADSRSNLMQFVKGWLGTEVPSGFDTFDLKGKQALVTIEHRTANSGREYASIAGIMGVPAQLQPAVAPVAPAPVAPAPVAPVQPAPAAIPAPQPVPPAFPQEDGKEVVPF